ncbi:Six-bladed beta-propeller, TolB-like domain-containing protein [Aphelenchoides besseyi]|nr:Six-bladed beta-propeller, TolB-like domain-containing protein [Aphelenchoides besseyi]
MKAISCIIIICVLILTALFGLTVLLIIATEQPETPSERPYAFSQRPSVGFSKDLNSRFSAANSTRFQSPKRVNVPNASQTSDSNVSTSSTVATNAQTSTSTITVGNVEVTSKNVDLTTKMTTRSGIPLIKRLKPRAAQLQLSDGAKIMSIGVRVDNVFFVARTNGDVELFKLPAFDVMDRVHYSQPIHRLAYVDAKRAVVVESRNSTLRLLDSGRTTAQVTLDYQPLDLRTFNNSVFVLSRGGSTVYAYDAALRLKSQVFLELNVIREQNSCNFLQPVRDGIFISCEKLVLKFAMDGKLVGKAAAEDAAYSLAIDAPVGFEQIWVVKRGVAEIHVFNEHTLKFEAEYNTGESNVISVWTSIGCTENNVVYALDYVANTVKLYDVIE